MKVEKTFKDYIAEKLCDMGVEDNNGRYVSQSEIFGDLDMYLEEVSKEELIQWADEFKTEDDVPLVDGRIVVKVKQPNVDTSKWTDKLIGIS